MPLESGAQRAASQPREARVDMQDLLGPGARFTGSRRVIDLSGSLNQGIDLWVFACADCLRHLLVTGSRKTASVTNYGENLRYWFEYLVNGSHATKALCSDPTALSPLHIQAFATRLRALGEVRGWAEGSARSAFKSVKAVLVELFALGFLTGDQKRFFPRGGLSWRGEARTKSLSDSEQERLAQAVKADLSAAYHRRITLKPSDLQALRLLVIAHRQGLNLTPVLEMKRDAIRPGLIPGTIRITTTKHRNMKRRSGAGRSEEQSLVFSLSEGAVLQQAIRDTEPLLEEVPESLKDRIWLFRSHRKSDGGRVTCLNVDSVSTAVSDLVDRHDLRGDDGERLRVNLSRLRKSFFDRALRATDGDLVVTANLMGNTPNVAAMNYPSMNHSRVMEAARFLNEDYTQMIRVVPAASGSPPFSTPVAGCADTLHGELAPRDGHSHCDRYVMCLFCPSFAIAGTVDELWKLFSFQAFAKGELAHLDSMLGVERTLDEALEDLRARYRLAIPYIDEFTGRQFARSRVAQARTKTAEGLHHYWLHQVRMSERARAPDYSAPMTESPPQ